MSCKGREYRYKVRSKTQAELSAELPVVFAAYQNAGWKEVGYEPNDGFPKEIIFEWPLDRLPIYPHIEL